MYLENIEELQALRPPGERSAKAKSKKLDFAFYMRALRSRKWPIAFFTALVTAFAVYYSLTATPVYSANATLLLESQKANIISIEELVSSEQESLDYFGTQHAILKSRALSERVLRHLLAQGDIPQTHLVRTSASSKASKATANLVGSAESESQSQFGDPESTATSPDIDEQSASSLNDPSGAVQDGSIELPNRQQNIAFEKTLNEFRDALGISPVVKTKLVKISFESPDPEYAALAANTLANQYILSVVEQRAALKGEASTWMDGRIAQLRIKLDESEDALLSFKKSNNLVALNGDVGRLNEQELLLANSELADANNELSGARDLYRKIQNYRATAPGLLETLPFVQNDVLVRSVKTELGQAQRSIAELRNRYGVKHPAVVDAESRVASLRDTLNGHIERTVTSFESDYQLLQQRVASLRNNVSQGKQSIQVIGQQKLTLDALEREVSANREQYNKLFDRITEIRTAEGLDEANAVLAEQAWIPMQPIKPNKKLLIGLALMGALFLSAAVAFLLEFLDNTVNSTDDVERRLNSRVLGVLPMIKPESSRRKSPLPLTPQDAVAMSDTFTEAINTCRTALTMSSDRKLQVILVTSSVPDEGKSSVALNLANSFGQLESTLLIDCDLRRPSIARALGIGTDTVGLSSFMLGEASYKDCVHRHVLNSFDCLTAGPSPEQPLEMLSSAKFAKSLEILRHHYDKIIIDSAPANVVSDALVLSRITDGVLYVVKPRHTAIKLIDSGLSRLASASGKVLGVCISQFDVDKARSNGGLDFHGFGVNYRAYGEYYRHGGKPNRQLKGKLA